MTDPVPHRQPDPVSDSRLSRILDRYGLQVETELDGNEDYLTLKCRSDTDEPLVLKYCRSGSADALRRLRNEAILSKDLPVRPPLRLLRYRSHGKGYLITEYEPGSPLTLEHLGDPALMPLVADALAVLQSLGGAVGTLGVSRRETTTRFLMKVMIKHLIHLWPGWIGAGDALRAFAILRDNLQDIAVGAVPCHADLLPTNMIGDDGGESIVFADLEGFIISNHPLYDVLSFFTIDERPVERWDWQPSFLQRYLERAPAAARLEPGAPAFARAYRGLFAYMLVYRYNEARINAANGRYFDGRSRARYVAAKSVLALSGIGFLKRPEKLPPDLAIRRDNLRHALDPGAFAKHLARMLGRGTTTTDPIG